MITCAILIPSLVERMDSWHNLLETLHHQIALAGANNQFDIITNIDDGTKSIGQKRNELITQATRSGFDYVAFFDDDDQPGEKYIEVLKAGIESAADVVSLRGHYIVDGVLDGVFEHSIKYNAYRTNNEVLNGIKYERYPNHLNCMKLSIAAQFKFPEINHGEDTNFATQAYRSGLLKKEYRTNEIIYKYLYNSKK